MPYPIKAQQLRREMGGLSEKMSAIIQKADHEKRALTAEEEAEWDKLDEEYETKKKMVGRLEREEERQVELETLDRRQAGREPTIVLPNGPNLPTDERAQKVLKAWRAFLREAPGEWSPEIREIIQSQRADLPPEARALGLTGAAGGFTVPQEFMAELDRALKSFAGIAQAARIITTATGAAMPWPTVNDSGNSGVLLAEASAAPDTVDPVFAATTFDAFVYTSQIVRVANQLIQDSAFNLDSELALMLGERLGRIMNTHGTTGDGVSKPRGVVTAVLALTTPVIAAASTAIAYGDLVELEHAVDPAYRARNPIFMMHDTILKLIKKLVDSTGRPLWASGIAAREPDTILGHPFTINQAMDAAPPALGKETVLFGDFSKYIIRRVLNASLVILRERYAEFFQTGFVMFMRWDSDLVDAGTGPIKVLQHP